MTNTGNTEHLPQPNITLILINQIRGEHFNIRVGDPNDPKNRAVERLLRRWDDDNCDPIQVRPDGHGAYLVVDGMHRLAAMLRLGYTKAWCRIIDTPTIKEAAALFVNKQQGTTPLKSTHVFLARVIQEDAAAVAVKDAAAKYGVLIRDYDGRVAGKPKGVGSIDTLLRIYRRFGKDVLESTLNILAKAYPTNPLGFRSVMLDACALFVHTYDSRFGDESYRVSTIVTRLSERLPTVDITTTMAKSRELSKSLHQSPEVMMAKFFLDVYNTSLRRSRLPDRLPSSKTGAQEA